MLEADIHKSDTLCYVVYSFKCHTGLFSLFFVQHLRLEKIKINVNKMLNFVQNRQDLRCLFAKLNFFM